MKSRYVTFTLGPLTFEYDEEKNRKNIQKHKISFKSAARVFFDYDRIECDDEDHSQDEERYNTIGNILAVSRSTMIGKANFLYSDEDAIVFVVYTERIRKEADGNAKEITRLISARFATDFERGLYYGKW